MSIIDATETGKIHGLLNQIESALFHKLLLDDLPAFMTADDKALELIPFVMDFYWSLYLESTWAASSTMEGLPDINRLKQVPDTHLDEADFILAMLDIHDGIRLDLIATYRAIHPGELLVVNGLTELIRYYGNKHLGK